MIYLYIKKHNKTKMKYLGKTSSKNPNLYKGSGKIVVNNGLVERCINAIDDLPEGFIVGRIKRRFYTNGIENKRLKVGEYIPEGFYLGRTL